MSSSIPSRRWSKRTFEKDAEASIPLVNIDSFESIGNEPLNNFSFEELNNQLATSDTIMWEQSPEIEVSFDVNYILIDSDQDFEESKDIEEYVDNST